MALLGATLLGWGIVILSVLISVIGAVVLILGAGGIRLAGGLGRHLRSVAVAGLAGIGLILGCLLAQHSSGGLAALELSCGLLVVLAASAAVLRPRARPPAIVLSN